MAIMALSLLAVLLPMVAPASRADGGAAMHQGLPAPACT